jgi:hypothetical protein
MLIINQMNEKFNAFIKYEFSIRTRFTADNLWTQPCAKRNQSINLHHIYVFKIHLNISLQSISRPPKSLVLRI